MYIVIHKTYKKFYYENFKKRISGCSYGPSFLNTNVGLKPYKQNGQLHNELGPAVIDHDEEFHYINDNLVGYVKKEN